jgi:hypothetical protein
MGVAENLPVSLPRNQFTDMERTAREENRTVSDLVGELYRRYMSDEARREFARAVENLRTEAAKTPAAKLTMRQIDAEIAAARWERKRRLSRRFASSSIPTSCFRTGRRPGPCISDAIMAEYLDVLTRPPFFPRIMRPSRATGREACPTSCYDETEFDSEVNPIGFSRKLQAHAGDNRACRGSGG